MPKEEVSVARRSAGITRGRTSKEAQIMDFYCGINNIIKE